MVCLSQVPFWGLIAAVNTTMLAIYEVNKKISPSLCLKYRGPILCVTWPALGSNDLHLEQLDMSNQILPEPNAGHVTLFL